MSHLSRIFLGAILLPFFCGCISLHRYPTAWPPITSTSQPTEVQGFSATYSILGEDDKGKPANLGKYLLLQIDHNPQHSSQFRAVDDDLEKAHSILLTYTKDEMLKIVAEGNGVHREWSFERARGGLKVEGGAIKVWRSGDGSGDNVAAFESKSIKLYRVGDELIIQQRNSSAGVVLLIPAGGYSITWARFKPK